MKCAYSIDWGSKLKETNPLLYFNYKNFKIVVSVERKVEFSHTHKKYNNNKKTDVLVFSHNILQKWSIWLILCSPALLLCVIYKTKWTEWFTFSTNSRFFFTKPNHIQLHFAPNIVSKTKNPTIPIIVCHDFRVFS